MNRLRPSEPEDWRKHPLLLGLLTLFGVQVIASLWQRFVHDGPLLQYAAYLIVERHRIPYRDLFDVNLPGTYLFHIFWIKTFGYGDFGFRLLDILWLSAVLSLLYLILKRFGRIAGLMSVAIAGLIYISDAPRNSLQREWIIALPLLLAVYLVVEERFRREIRAFFIGVLFGLVFSIKPHSVILWPLLVIFDATSSESVGFRAFLRRSAAFGALTLIGFAMVITPIIWWLKAHSAWSPFLDIAKNYYPLYASLSGGHELTSGIKRVQMLINETLRMGGAASWVMAAGVGTWLVGTRTTLARSDKRIIVLLWAAVGCYLLYTTITGQFWGYHFVLMEIFLCPLAAAMLFHRELNITLKKSWFPTMMLLAALFLGPRIPLSTDFIYQVIHRQVKPPKYGRVDEMSDYLKAHLAPGDAVQPLDWTGGAVHSALIAKADLATSFIWDMPFYHNIDNSYIIGLRKRFINELTASNPRFILQVTAEDKPWPYGPNTTRSFFELENFMLAHYRIARERNGYCIWERIEASHQDDGRL